MREKLPKCIRILFILAPLASGATYRRPHEEVTLTPALAGPFEELLWNYNGDKVLQYHAGGATSVFGDFQGRASLNQQTGELRVRDLRKADSGRYTARMLVSGTLRDSSLDVRVMDTVSRPTVRCEHVDSVAILRCHSEGEMTRYRWEGPQDLSSNWTDRPTEQRVSGSDSAYTCVVKNPVSEERSEAFPADRCFKGLFAHRGAAAVIVILVAFVLSVSGFAIGAHWMRRNSRHNGLRGEAGQKDEERELLKHHEGKKGGLRSQNTSEDDNKTRRHTDSLPETHEKKGEKVMEVEEKVANRASGNDAFTETNTNLVGQNTPVDGSQRPEDDELAAASNEKERKKGKNEEEEKKNKSSRGFLGWMKGNKGNKPGPETKPGSCSQNTSEDDSRTQGHVDSAAEINEKEGEKVKDEKQETRVSETNINLVGQNTPVDGSQRPEDDELAAASNEKEGKKGKNEEEKKKNKSSGGFLGWMKGNKGNKPGPETKPGSCSQNTSEDDSRTQGHVDSAAETHEKEGEKVKDEKQETRVSETTTDPLLRDPSMGENKRPEDNKSATAPNEKEGKKEKKRAGKK